MSTESSRVQEVQEFKVLAPKSEMLLLAKSTQDYEKVRQKQTRENGNSEW